MNYLRNSSLYQIKINFNSPQKSFHATVSWCTSVGLWLLHFHLACDHDDRYNSNVLLLYLLFNFFSQRNHSCK